jgi:hypothetical protein
MFVGAYKFSLLTRNYLKVLTDSGTRFVSLIMYHVTCVRKGLVSE